MKRRCVILIALVFLLIGVAVNVGVAWGCASLLDRGALSSGLAADSAWPRPAPDRWPECWRIDQLERFGVRQSIWSSRPARVMQHPYFYVSWLAPPPQVPPNPVIDNWRTSSMTIVDAGWPLRSMRWERWSEEVWFLGESLYSRPRMEGHPRSLYRTGLPLGGSTDARLPFQVLPGFAVNTLLYAALAAALWYGLGALQRARRRQRGCCLKCGYPRAGLAEGVGGAVCLECGGVPAR